MDHISVPQLLVLKQKSIMYYDLTYKKQIQDQKIF